MININKKLMRLFGVTRSSLKTTCDLNLTLVGIYSTITIIALLIFGLTLNIHYLMTHDPSLFLKDLMTDLDGNPTGNKNIILHHIRHTSAISTVIIALVAICAIPFELFMRFRFKLCKPVSDEDLDHYFDKEQV